MTQPSPLDLVALICSKLCHDLAGSVGAVNNGVELLAEETDPMMRDEALRLVAQSARDAARRLAFFRLALGASGGLDDAMPAAELARVAADYFAGGRVTLLPPEGALPAALPKPLGKALLLGLWAMAGALPRGGQLRLVAGGDDWRIEAAGAMVRVPDALGAGLSAGTAALPDDPNAALARMCRDLAASAGHVLVLDVTETAASLSLRR